MQGTKCYFPYICIELRMIMKRTVLLSIGMAVALLLGLVSCESKPIVGELPEYGNLKFTKAPRSTLLLDRQNDIPTLTQCEAGDSVTVFMQVAFVGAYIYNADYEWNLIAGDESQEAEISVVAPTKQTALPMWTFKAPEVPGRYAVTFKAHYDFSANTALGTVYGESQSYSADFVVAKPK